MQLRLEREDFSLNESENEDCVTNNPVCHALERVSGLRGWRLYDKWIAVCANGKVVGQSLMRMGEGGRALMQLIVKWDSEGCGACEGVGLWLNVNIDEMLNEGKEVPNEERVRVVRDTEFAL